MQSDQKTPIWLRQQSRKRYPDSAAGSVGNDYYLYYFSAKNHSSYQTGSRTVEAGSMVPLFRLVVALPILQGQIRYTHFLISQQLSAAALEDLQNLKLGYRAKYIFKTTQDVCNRLLDLEYLKTLNYQDSMFYPKTIYGIGEKVANCICLFGLHHIDAFPVDTWIQKILMDKYYPVTPGVIKPFQNLP